ncbi:sigma 54-interacting transcriptional regulator [Lachnospiraceae bacterium ZAX-1]
MDKPKTIEWNSLHHDYAYRQVLPIVVADSWDRCYQHGIDPKHSVWHTLSASEVESLRISSEELYYYSNTPLKNLAESYLNDEIGFALFTFAGILYKLYGNSAFLQHAANRGLLRYTDWSEDIAGTNAISLGLTQNKTFSLLNGQSFCHQFLGFHQYFAPIYIEQMPQDKILTNKVGGIALLDFGERLHPIHTMAVTSTAHEISLRMWVIRTSMSISQSDKEQGSLTIDRSSGKNHILYYNDTLSDVLPIQKKLSFYDNLEHYIDPYPHNRDFWDRLNAERSFPEQNMLLRIGGIVQKYSLKFERYIHDSLGINSTLIRLRSMEQINKFISKRIGNNAHFTFFDILGDSAIFHRSIEQAQRVAATESNVLITGESGVGKDIFAQAIHNAGKRRGKPFIAINCAALPRELIASELFGYDEGAFTGSKKGGNIGKFELANKGTIFLDEIGDMPIDLQATLLRVIEERSFTRLGSTLQVSVDVRILAATNANIEEKIHQKKFREDLFYRLSVLRLKIPPLRQRKGDIILLAEHFISQNAQLDGKQPPMLSEDARSYLKGLYYKGNIRELQNLMEGIVQLYQVPLLTREHIIDYLGEIDANGPSLLTESHIAPPKHVKSYIPDSRAAIEDALLANRYNKEKTAAALGISKRTLYRRLKEYQLL